MSETVCVWEREWVRERLLVWRVLLKMFRDGAVLVALGYNSAACPLLMSGDTTILMNSHYGKIWRNRAPELPESLTLGVKFLHTSSLSQLAIITPEALNSCCVFIFLFKLTLLALITKFRQPSVCQPRRQRPQPPPQKEMGVISTIAVCVLLPFHLIVLYGVPSFHQGFAEAYNIKKHTYNRHVSETPKTSEQNSSHRKGKMFQRAGSMT